MHTPLRGGLLYKASSKLRVMLQDEAGFGRINNTERHFRDATLSLDPVPGAAFTGKPLKPSQRRQEIPDRGRRAQCSTARAGAVRKAAAARKV